MESPCQDQFISRRFLVAKKDGSFRPVVNLKPLNCFVQKFYFKMEGSEMIKDLLRTEDWMCTLDLKDAYLSVAVVQENWKFMRFMWDRKIYEFTCLPFGLQCPPHIYKASQASHGILAEAGTTIDHLPRQHSDHASVQGRLATPGGIDSAAAAVFGLYHQQREITAESIPADPVPRVPSGLQANEILPPRGESTGHTTETLI